MSHRSHTLGFWTATSLVTGNMIGSGIFLLPASLATFGAISLAGWLFSTVGSIFLALVFAGLARQVRGSGGPYLYTHAGFGEEPGADIALHLARHCPQVELDRIPSSGHSIAQAVLARTIAASGDLIIMGGYGHSMLRESFFGGVTREIIHQTSVPLLLAH